jgi:transcriptional regulator with XRE-family HTH domain
MTGQEAIALRQELGLSQNQLADFINKNVFKMRHKIERGAISAMENGRNDVAWYVKAGLELLQKGQVS